MTRLTSAVLALSTALILGACDDDDSPTDASEPTITDIVTESASATEPEFSLLLDAVLYVDETNPDSDVVAALFDADQQTVFAPTDQAFGDLVAAVSSLVDPDVLANDGPFAAIDDLLGAGTVEAVLGYHVTDGRLTASDVLPGSAGTRTIPTLLAGASFSVTATGEIEAVGNTATIIDTDITASNGVIHVIDAVILPIDLGMAQATAENRRAPEKGGATIAEIVEASANAADPEFTLLKGAIDYIAATNPESSLLAGLLDREQYTVFAPNDVAFANLVTAVAADLDPDVLADEGPFAAIDDLLGAGTIEAVVSYHVAEGRRAANSVVPPNEWAGDRTIETLFDGATFSVAFPGAITAVGSSATILAPDISASNGIIHEIDTVLLPIDLGL